jgi:hypothetical protein
MVLCGALLSEGSSAVELFTQMPRSSSAYDNKNLVIPTTVKRARDLVSARVGGGTLRFALDDS